MMSVDNVTLRMQSLNVSAKYKLPKPSIAIPPGVVISALVAAPPSPAVTRNAVACNRGYDTRCRCDFANAMVVLIGDVDVSRNHLQLCRLEHSGWRWSQPPRPLRSQRLRFPAIVEIVPSGGITTCAHAFPDAIVTQRIRPQAAAIPVTRCCGSLFFCLPAHVIILSSFNRVKSRCKAVSVFTLSRCSCRTVSR